MLEGYPKEPLEKLYPIGSKIISRNVNGELKTGVVIGYPGPYSVTVMEGTTKVSFSSAIIVGPAE